MQPAEPSHSLQQITVIESLKAVMGTHRSKESAASAELPSDQHMASHVLLLHAEDAGLSISVLQDLAWHCTYPDILLTSTHPEVCRALNCQEQGSLTVVLICRDAHAYVLTASFTAILSSHILVHT